MPEDHRTKAAHAVRLLVVDGAYAPGGIERSWLALMPELARRCEHLVWMVPLPRLETLKQSFPADAPIRFETFNWQGLGASRIIAALVRRLAQLIHRDDHAALQRWETRLELARIRAVARAHRATHVLYPALFTQTFPHTRLPVFAAIMDVNYAPFWRVECMANLHRWATQASGFFSISEFTRDEIERICPEVRGKVVAAPLAAVMPAARVLPDSGEKSAAAAPQLPRVYYPGGFSAHKGHMTLLKAARKLFDDGFPIRLELTGGGVERMESAIPLEISELEEARSILTGSPESFRRLVELRGHVPEGTLEECYANADLIALPSRYEGFGLPLAESVVRGKQVLAADIPAFREQVRLYDFGQAVTFVEEPTASHWAAALKKALLTSRDPSYRAEQLRALFDRWQWGHVADIYMREFAKIQRA